MTGKAPSCNTVTPGLLYKQLSPLRLPRQPPNRALYPSNQFATHPGESVSSYRKWSLAPHAEWEARHLPDPLGAALRESPPLLLSPMSLTKVPVTYTARVPGSSWGEWGRLLSHTETSPESHPSSEGRHALSEAAFTTCSGQVTLGKGVQPGAELCEHSQPGPSDFST